MSTISKSMMQISEYQISDIRFINSKPNPHLYPYDYLVIIYLYLDLWI